MSYVALARKWRPKKFAEMIGQDHVRVALTNSLNADRVHHAFLFTGTRGVGKTTIARILAKCLNCERGVSAEPCGVCSACVEIDGGRFPDLLEVDAASRTKVDDTRELLDNVQYAPTRGRYKVYLIDEVHMLSTHSFNALLKTLEEPPPRVKFLLATTDPQKLPVTVLSRCLQFNLKRLPVNLIAERMKAILEAEGIEHEAPAIRLVAQAADGSVRDGLSLLDQLIAFGGGKVSENEARSMLGTISRDHVVRMADLLAEENGVELLQCAGSLEEFSPDYSQVLEELAALFAKIALKQVVPDFEGDDLYAPELLERLGKAIAPEDVQLYYQTAIIGRRDLHLAPEPRVGFEMTLLRMLAFRPAGAQSMATAAPAGASSHATPPSSGTGGAHGGLTGSAAARAAIAGRTDANSPGTRGGASRQSDIAQGPAASSSSSAASLHGTPAQQGAGRASSHSDLGQQSLGAGRGPSHSDPGQQSLGADRTPSHGDAGQQSLGAGRAPSHSDVGQQSLGGGHAPSHGAPGQPSAGGRQTSQGVPGQQSSGSGGGGSRGSNDAVGQAPLSAASHASDAGNAARGSVGAPVSQVDASVVDRASSGGTPPGAGAGEGAISSMDDASAPAAWVNIFSRLDLQGATRQLASHCVWLGRQGNVVRLALDPRTKLVRTPAQQDKLSQALSKHFGESLRVEIDLVETVAETPAQAENRASAEQLDDARRSLDNDPNVRAFKERFGATLLPETVRPAK